jgi:hypothetical protein
LVVVAAVVAVIYFVLRQQPAVETVWQDPMAAIRPEEIAIDLALYPLAGALELETVDAAIANGDLETAYATLVFGLELTDAQRAGRLVLLGGRFVEAEKLERAALCYQQVYDMAVLEPNLSDPARADALLAAGRGWASLGDTERALEVYDQVHLVAMESPYLQMANRRDLLVALEAAYEALGREDLAEASRAETVELDRQTQPQPPAVPGDRPGLGPGEGVLSSAEVGALEEARRQAAFDLLQAYSAQGEAPADLVAGLAQALQAEDGAKLALYEQELEGATQPGRRIDAHWQTIRWLMLKYQVAAGGFGLSLVPQWEESIAEIQSDLSKAYESLFFDYEDLVTALPVAGLIGPGSYQVRREVILDGRLGRYVNYPARQLTDKLQDAVQELIASGAVDRLYVDVTSGEEGQLHFYLSPAGEYGQPVQSP